MDLAIFIFICAFSRWGACIIVHYAKTETPVFIRSYNRWITTPGGFLCVKAYTFLSIPIACFNGFLMSGYRGLIIAGLVTFFWPYLGMRILMFLNRDVSGRGGRGGGGFTFYGAIILIWTVVNIFRFVGSFAPAEDVPQFAEDALAATVYLEMTDAQVLPISYGSGFFVSQEHIVTNYHVIAGAAHGTAKRVGKTRTYLIQGIIAIDVDNDLALLQVTIPDVKPLRLGDSNKVRIGDQVYVAGSPKGLEGTFSDGIISRISRREGKEHLQMTAPISPGSSGGPVLNSKGKVIGVAFMTMEGGQNLNFAIPSKYVKALLNTKGTLTPLAQREHDISAETYYYRGNTKHDIGFYQNAISDYSKAIRLKPDFVKAYHHRGNTKALLGQHFEAIADFDIAIELAPDNAMSYYNRGTAKGALGEYFEAIADFDTAIKLQPDDAMSYYLRGRAKAELGEYFEAIADFDTAIKLEIDSAMVYNDRGVAKAKLGEYFEAIADFNAVIQLTPDDASAYNNRGTAKGALGEYFEAIADFDTAIKLQPDDAMSYYLRGRAKAELGQTWAAKQDFRTALKLTTQAGDVELKKHILRLLE